MSDFDNQGGMAGHFGYGLGETKPLTQYPARCADHITTEHKRQLGSGNRRFDAQIAIAAGERQTQCKECRRWYFPNEVTLTKSEDDRPTCICVVSDPETEPGYNCHGCGLPVRQPKI